MRVLLLNQVFYPDGVATAQHTADLARYLIENGCRVTVVTGRRGYEDRSQIFSAHEVYQGIEIFRVHSTGFGKRSFFHRFIDAITFEILLVWRLLITPGHDVTICFTSPPLIGFLGVFYKFLKGGRLVQWLMDINPHVAIGVGYLKKGSLVSRFLLWAFRFTLRHSDQAVVLDRWMRETISEEGMDASKIVVVPPWPVHKPVDPATKSSEENPFRVEHGLRGKFVVLYSGNHSVVHPLNTLLDCAVRLRDNDDIRFVFIGTGLRAREVTERKEKEGLSNILQLPYQPREMLVHSLSMADLHVVILGNEVSGLVHASKIYGVLATGKPYVAIAPRKSHLVDVISECPGGYHVEHGDVEGLIRIIQKAGKLSDSEKAKISVENSTYVSKKYGPEQSLGHFLNQVILRGQDSGSSRVLQQPSPHSHPGHTGRRGAS